MQRSTALKQKQSDCRHAYESTFIQYTQNKNAHETELESQKEHIALLNQEFNEADTEYMEVQQQFIIQSKIEKERANIIKEKNNLLIDLMNNEKPHVKSHQQKRIKGLNRSIGKRIKSSAGKANKKKMERQLMDIQNADLPNTDTLNNFNTVRKTSKTPIKQI